MCASDSSVDILTVEHSAIGTLSEETRSPLPRVIALRSPFRKIHIISYPYKYRHLVASQADQKAFRFPFKNPQPNRLPRDRETPVSPSTRRWSRPPFDRDQRAISTLPRATVTQRIEGKWGHPSRWMDRLVDVSKAVSRSHGFTRMS